MRFIYDLHQSMITHNVILIYEGDFTQETTKSILSMAERNLESSGEESGIKKRIFNVMVEALQNIVKHSDEIEVDKSKSHAAIFLIGNEQSRYSIMSGNPVRKENIPTLKNALEKINSLDKDGLKELYKEIIKNTTISEKGGAGLGFVDMARKSGEKLEWDFVDVNEEYSFFCLKVNIARAKEAVA
ncbi:MAG: SiaB family protein kinase [Cyclobacteriaceae bacterium]|nr:SiaB family protein kinase [Cyclobacteriaceae bacterium]